MAGFSECPSLKGFVHFWTLTIKKLYKREKLYASKPDYYTPDRIKDARNDEYTNGIYNTFM